MLTRRVKTEQDEQQDTREADRPSASYSTDSLNVNSDSLESLTAAVRQLQEAMTRRVSGGSGGGGSGGGGSSEFQVFGQSVAAQLSKMPLEDALELQADIQQLITKKRIYRMQMDRQNK